MRKHLPFFICALLIGLVQNQMNAQGCVAIRAMGGCGNSGTAGMLHAGQWQVGSTYRYFESYKHFRGKHEETERVENGTNVINNSHFLDLNVTYAFTNRFSVFASIPFVYNDRSSLYEHNRKERYHTQSAGLADIRLAASYWVINPDKYHKGNVSVGLGFKLPTGDYDATDEFVTGENGETTVKSVDQSIQPGDGGFGITFEVNGFHQIVGPLNVYGSGYYLMNPREDNGTPTYRSNKYEAIMSVPDQYLARVGLSYTAPWYGLGASLGVRTEGVPVYDLVGGSDWFRRPGYAFSIEPGLSWNTPNFSFFVNVPVAMVRNRPQSVPDKQTTEETGVYKNGDAAFADYSLLTGVSWRFGGKKTVAAVPATGTWKEAGK